MENKDLGRRSFLGLSAMGAAAMATTSMFGVYAAENTADNAKKIFVCSICGHVEFGVAPDLCPVCHSPKENYGRNDALFSDALAKSPELAAGHVPEIIVDKSSKLIVEQPSKQVMVRVGKKLHPMLASHYIQWIDCYVDDHYLSRSSLLPGSNPAVSFYPQTAGIKVRAIEHCNLHGHWQAEAML